MTRRPPRPPSTHTLFPHTSPSGSARAEGPGPALGAAQIDGYNPLARAQSGRRGAAFLDITTLSRCHGNDATLLAADGLHPGAAMHALWADAALPVVTAMPLKL